MSGMLNHTPAQIIRKLLVDLSLATDAGDWPARHSVQVDTPDNAIFVGNTAGRLQGKLHVTSETQEVYGIIIQVRGVNETTAILKANAIMVAMDSVLRSSVTISEGGATGTYRVWAVTRTSPVLPLGRESPTSSRRLATVNFVTSIRQVS